MSFKFKFSKRSKIFAASVLSRWNLKIIGHIRGTGEKPFTKKSVKNFKAIR
jgi:hypothetical protein